MKFTDAALDVIERLVKASDQLDAEERELTEKFKREIITGRFYADQRAELDRRRDRARLAAQTELAGLRRKYADAAREADRLSGGQLHEDAALLRLDGLVLTRDQFDDLANRHRDNVLMTQLLLSYAGRHRDCGYDVSGLPPAADQRIAAFNDFIDSCSTACTDVHGLHIALIRSGQATPAACAETVA